MGPVRLFPLAGLGPASALAASVPNSAAVVTKKSEPLHAYRQRRIPSDPYPAPYPS